MGTCGLYGSVNDRLKGCILFKRVGSLKHSLVILLSGGKLRVEPFECGL